ncbi:alpha/beta hydrolase [Flavihumibacter rivuli]|uniref:alpha/beta fold hydrolase n=1 Tax=Flavihumibacter rivuli TaxID=2838156 RepID=UPI001BDED0AB|nr:alpha/beta hydrolase [Flavihumibacter rivuli]ULQ55931.1 alpha/beta hydrolase [Flavihumibacter rivuli]
MKYLFLFSIGLSSLLFACEKKSDSLPSLKRELVTVEGSKVEIARKKGQSPTIVLIGGFGSELSTWNAINERIDKSSGVFTYNRPGIGKSENVAGTRDALTIALELDKVLQASGQKPPYVLVAHSMGGIYARMYYHLFPNKVKGLCLVDATHERQLDSLLSMVPETERQNIITYLEQQQEELLSKMPQGALKEELRSNFRTNYEQIKAKPPISNIPVYVITSIKPTNEEPAETKKIIAALHEEWARAAGNKGKFVTTVNSGHYIQVEEPDLAAAGIAWLLLQ